MDGGIEGIGPSGHATVPPSSVSGNLGEKCLPMIDLDLHG